VGKTLTRHAEILLVEDNPGDVDLTREGLQGGRIPNRVHVVEDGEEAMAFLRREGAYAGKPRPDLILLDLNLPRRDGREVLEEIKNDQELKAIPVVIFTSSQNGQDVLRSYEAQANCYVTKPIAYSEYVHCIRSILEFWLQSGRLPSPSPLDGQGAANCSMSQRCDAASLNQPSS
jgi:CheY-like chemotaxis protein